MPKLKNFTAEQVKELVEKAEDAAGWAKEAEKAASAMRLDELPALEYGRSLVTSARMLLDLASSLFVQHEIQEMRAKRKAMEGGSPAALRAGPAGR
jgi:predicted S18 family serine protease